MYSASQVKAMIEGWKKAGITKAELAVKIANACMGWPYVWGARGEEDTVENRKYFMNRSSIGDKDRQMIIDRCQVLKGTKDNCDGCKYYPNNMHTRIFDCRGFTYWVLLQCNITINGAGATSQYNDDSNWSEKGKIEYMPRNVVCCVFKQVNGKTMEHTGLYTANGKIVHCSKEVKESSPEDKSWSWTHYAIPKGIDSDTPVVSKPTLRKGDTGEYVVECQQDLLQLGYDLSPYGADGKYGNTTIREVKKFQKASGLVADGICGPRTWQALDEAVKPSPTPTKFYTVHIPHLTEYQADSLIATYSGSWKTEEQGG